MESSDHEFKDTGKLVDWILSIEGRYPVETWTINDLYVWPIIRNSLNISLFYHFNSTQESKIKVRTKFTLLSKIGHYLKSITRLFLLCIKPLKKSTVLFSGANNHRDYYRGKWVNKFFDPIIMRDPTLGDSYIVEYHEENSNSSVEIFREHQVIKLNDYLLGINFAYQFFKKRSPRVFLPRHADFLIEMELKSLSTRGFTLKDLLIRYSKIEKYSSFYKLLIEKIEPKQVIGLSYYCNQMYGLNLASARKGIPSTDIQHGGQGALHLAYAQFTKLPMGGFYNVLPHSFWCWDEFSFRDIQKWITTLKSNHTAFVGGHPWLELLKSSAPVKSDLPIVLYTLQPYGVLVDSYILKSIKLLHGKVKWVLRLHPRQHSELNKLNSLIKENSLEKDIVNDLFQHMTLPEALASSAIHLTKSSGAVIEAALMNIPSIVLDDLGAALFKDWIASGRAVQCLDNDENVLTQSILKVLTA